MKIVLAEKIADEGVQLLARAHRVVTPEQIAASSLEQELADADALVVRSQTRVTKELLERAPRLKAIARAGVGVDNVDVACATARGIVVVNCPGASTVSAAEHAVALMLAVLRHLPQAVQSVRRGQWTRSRFMGGELRGKTIGIMGFGRIGREVAQLLKGFQVRLLGMDPMVSAETTSRLGVELVGLDALLAESDIITIHVPLTDETRQLIDADAIGKMKDGAYLVNCARGGVVDEQALAAALRSGKLAGAAVDVFAQEPPADCPLLELDNCITTPHLAGSTREAQVEISRSLAEDLLAALAGKPPRDAVNLSFLPPELRRRITPYLELARKMGNAHAQIARGVVGRVEVVCEGDFEREAAEHITASFLVGLFEEILEKGSVNLVNARAVARTLDIELVETTAPPSGGFRALVATVVVSDAETRRVEGTITDDGAGRIVRLLGYEVELKPAGHMILTRHHDVPGVVASVASALADRKINISEMHLARTTRAARR